MPPSLDIRPAGPDDAAALIALYKHLSPDAPQCPLDVAQANIRKLDGYAGSAVMIGKLGVQMVSSCMLIVVPNLTRGGAPFAVIENVVTHTDHRRCGFGKAMLDAACARAWECGCYKVMLSTGSKNPKTLAFYEDAGFSRSRTGFKKRKLPRRVG